MKIIILGDSLALKRPWEGINEENTYAHKLKKYGISINKSRYANTTFKQLKKIKSDIYETKFDVYVIQLGIVDCCPRIFTYHHQRFLSLLNIFFPKLIKFYIDKQSKNRYEKTKKKMIVFTTKNKYKQNMKEIINTILNHNKPKKIFLINIAFPSKSLKEKNYDVENQIIKYNNILNQFQNETISIIDLFSFTKNNPDSLVGDEHISKKGHNFILDNLKSYITTLY